MREEFQWAVGLFEGEGSVSVKDSKRRKWRYKYALLSLVSTDKDVLRKFFRIVSVGSFNGGRKGYNQKSRGKRKPYWSWSVRGKAAEILCKKFLPYLGQRRKQRAKHVLKEVKQWQITHLLN